MPKTTRPSGFSWRQLVAVAAGLLLFVALFESTALATRQVQSMLFADERFFLESNMFAGPGPDGARRRCSRPAAVGRDLGAVDRDPAVDDDRPGDVLQGRAGRS